MKCPRDKYQNDPYYRTLIDLMLEMIYKCQFTPSEMRKAAMLASIKYEEMNIRKLRIPHTEELEKALHIVRKWTREEAKDA